MSVLSNAFHSILDTIKSGFADLFSKAVSDFQAAVPVVMHDLETDVIAMGPIALQLAGDAVAALTGAPGMSIAIEAAAKALAGQGIIVAEHALYGLVAGIVASQPTPSVATAGGPIATPPAPTAS